MRDLIADWRRWTWTDRAVGLATLTGATLVAALPYLLAA